MKQHALVAVDIGQARHAGSGRPIAGVEGEHAGLAVELADIKHIRADRSVDHGQRHAVAGVVVGKGYGLRCVGICGHACPRFNLA